MQQYSEQDLIRVIRKLEDLEDYTIEFASEIDHRDLLADTFEAFEKLKRAYVTILQYQSKFQHIKDLVGDVE